MAKFFVSYSRSVKDEVRNVIDLLTASGHEIWWDEDIPSMADWWATILDKIEWCEVFIFVASEKSVQSAYCLAELKYASDRQRPILPFILDDPATLTLPSALPSRGQWLLYNGNPAQMLTQINTAYNSINWALHRDIKVRRPSEPLTGGKSLAKQFQAARQLANDKKFEEAISGFANIKHLDYGEWGTECDEWLGRLNSYVSVMDLVDDESTLTRARTSWAMHSRQYGKEFDPHGIEQKLRRVPSTKPRLPYVTIVTGALVIGTLIIGLLIASSGSNIGDITPTNNEFALAVANTETSTEATAPTQDIYAIHSATDTAQFNTTLTLLAPTITSITTLTPTDTPILSGNTITPSPTDTNTPDNRTQATNPMAEDTYFDDLPSGCLYHVIENGDDVSKLGLEYEVNYLDIMTVNNFTEEDVLHLEIGDIIIIPLEGCPIERFNLTAVATEDDTSVDNILSTLPATAIGSRIEITVNDAGDITHEAVYILNNGPTTDISNWKLSDIHGNTYSFDQGSRIFSEAAITIFTRTGSDTPIAHYQNKARALFSSGDVLILSDDDDEVQSTYRVP
ncbi:TIR domain-containing protein [Phototrophicus methaneseepsis]|uniref:TIR domain-containing protein n=1 Tax=Phototrophicus methaneseepsis TaxID=2710758 RepID=A0A7S8ECS0_9CHLR|nr:TIR domain-containing protein [Phototrophicus methaneseepsis]QPC84549.1 TIR domain-containing protein [Phototrophicus methaneseepsis]